LQRTRAFDPGYDDGDPSGLNPYKVASVFHVASETPAYAAFDPGYVDGDPSGLNPCKTASMYYAVCETPAYA